MSTTNAQNGTDRRQQKVRLRNGTAYINKVNSDTWHFYYNTIEGIVTRKWSGMLGWTYMVGSVRDRSGTILADAIRGSARTLNDAIQGSWQHIMTRIQKAA